MKKYYITTAIAYASKTPHIGNTYEAVLTDVISRYKKQRGYDVYFLTGSDEHGQKIQEEAILNGRKPKEHVDIIVDEIKDIWKSLDVEYDKFIRTTDEEHKNVVRNIFKKLYENGDIYKSEYDGKYCVDCESFYTDSQLVDGLCQCGAEVKQMKEEAYFLKLSKYAGSLIEHIENNPEFIYPVSRKNEMLNNFIKPGLKDLCVSRTSFKWGIEVDFDTNHVVYVWIDALSNYITAIGYDVDKKNEMYNKYWPADLHVVGKDIVRFHTIYWPIMLMALGEELPKKVYGHPWLLAKEGKMSKSKGNTLYAKDLVEKYGVDRVRYSILREMPHSDDGHFSEDILVSRTNTDLVNIIGNLLNRTIGMNKKYFDSYVSKKSEYRSLELELIEEVKKGIKKYEEYMESLHISNAINSIVDIAKKTNKYIDDSTPWVLAKEEDKKDTLSTILYVLTENIRILGVLLYPFVPTTSKNILKQLNTNVTSYDSIYEYGSLEKDLKVNEASILFERIEIKEQEQLEFKEEIEFKDFEKLDLRVAKIIDANDHPNADRLYVLDLEVENTTRQVVSGIKNSYKKEELIGKKVILVANLKPVKIRGVISHGMLLAESDEEKLFLLEAKLESGAKIG